MQTRVQFLGLIIDAEGQHASNDKIEAVLKAPCPHDVKQLRSFLGMMNYYRNSFEAIDSSTAAWCQMGVGEDL